MDGTTAATDDLQDGLYETDFYAWTQHQAALLKTGRLNHLDAVNILEEIETLGPEGSFRIALATADPSRPHPQDDATADTGNEKLEDDDPQSEDRDRRHHRG